MEKLNTVRSLFYETYTKCLTFVKPAKPSTEYEQIKTSQIKTLSAEECIEENEDGHEWSTQESIYQNGNISSQKSKRKILIGNIDEENNMNRPQVEIIYD